MFLAWQKAAFALRRHPDGCIIGADTIVCIDNEIIGKTESEADAFHTLKRLQGRAHTVYTGIAVLKKEYSDIRFVHTKVNFRHMSDAEIRWYVSTGEPMDKAGSYGIQGLGSIFIDSIEGNYFNVIGLPSSVLYEMLVKANVIEEKGK